MIKLKAFQQSDISRCGPASIKMILDFYRIKASEDEIAKYCKHSYELGCTNEDTVRAFRCYGINATIKENCTIQDLKKYSDNNIPVIVDWFSHGTQPTRDDTSMGHYSVVIGVDEDFIYLLDPEDGNERKFRHKEFLRVWFDWTKDEYLTSKSKMYYQTIIIPYKKISR